MIKRGKGNSHSLLSFLLGVKLLEIMKLYKHINLVTDEDFELMEVIGFINDAIARINVKMEATYPFVEDDLPNEDMYRFEEYDAIPDHWQRMLFVPFAAGRIKENDSSQFEYSDWYAQFEFNLDQFYDKYEVPLVFKDLNTKLKRHEEDLSNNIFSPLRGW